MTKPKTLKLDSGDCGVHSMFINTAFAFAHARREKNRVIQLSGFDTCREEFANGIYDDVSREKRILSGRKLQCLVCITLSMYAIGREFERHTETGLKILNILEDHYGWPLTRMFSVEPVVGRFSGFPARQSFSKLLVASSKWRKSSHITSLFLLLFRLPTRSTKFFEVKDYEHLMQLCRQYAGIPEPGSGDEHKPVSGDKYYIAKTMKFWDPLFTNLNKLFRGMTSEDIFSKPDYNYYYKTEGISKLCGFRCSNPEINKRFAILAKNTGIDLPDKTKRRFGL